MPDTIEAIELRIANDLRQLGNRLEQGDDTQLLVWPIPDRLACAHRPLRHDPAYGGSARNLSSSATPLLKEWVNKIHGFGIRSIICLMHKNELSFYSQLNLGVSDLIEFYRLSGFSVCHIEWEDPHHSKTPPAIIERKKDEVRRLALRAYDEMTKPVLIHCSAGIQRSAPIAAFITSSRSP